MGQLYGNNGDVRSQSVTTFQDEVYKPHKKFRRHNSSFSKDDCPTSSTTQHHGPDHRPRLPTCLDTSEHLVFCQLCCRVAVAAVAVSLPVNCLNHPCNLHYWPQRLAREFPWPQRRPAKEMRSWLSSSWMAVESKFNNINML